MKSWTLPLTLLLTTACGAPESGWPDEYGDDVIIDSDQPTDTDEPTESESEEYQESEESEEEQTESDFETDTEEPELLDTLMLTEVCDHAIDSYVKYIEIYNPGEHTVSLDGWRIERYSNGGTEPGEVSLDDAFLAAGDTWVIANTTGRADFEARYARADQYSSTINGNGNDAYALVRPNGDIEDSYGVIGEDGTETVWDYTDSVATRKGSVEEPRSNFKDWEWRIEEGIEGASPGSR